MPFKHPRELMGWVRRLLRFGKEPLAGIAYWEKRVRKHGSRAVLNLGHSSSEMEEVTRRQMEILFPEFQRRLLGGEKRVLDYGCGPGRFTAGLAGMLGPGGRAIGMDPIPRLLELAPKSDNVEYRVCTPGVIPLPTQSMDAVWSCLVLGGIQGEVLSRTLAELDRVLIPGGLMFLVENTAEKADGKHWSFRSVPTYKSLFSFVPLEHVRDYEDLGERISVLAGRKSK